MGLGQPTRAGLGLKTVETGWDEFLAAVAVPGMPDEQIREMKRAFYAGAWAVVTTAERMGAADVPEKLALSHLEGMKADCRAFQKAVAEGRA